MILKRFETKFLLNNRIFEKTFRWPLEFCFLEENEIEEILSLDKGDEQSEVISFQGEALTKAQVKEIIAKKGREAENSLRMDFLPALQKELKLENKDIIHEFRGDETSWNALMTLIRDKEIVLFSLPVIQLKVREFDLPLQLNPCCISYYRGKFTLFLLSSNINPGKKYFSRFIFYDFLFSKYLRIPFSEWALINKTTNNNKLSFSFFISTVKTPKANSSSEKVPIFLVLEKEKPQYQYSIFSRMFEREEYLKKYDYPAMQEREKSNTKIIEAARTIKTEIIPRLKKSSDLAINLLNLLPDVLEENSTWFTKINWVNILSIDSLQKHYFNSASEFFSIEGKFFKKAICLLYPKFKIFGLIEMRRGKLFEVISKLGTLLSWKEGKIPSFENFLSSFFYSQKSNLKLSSDNSIFSIEGREFLSKKITSIEWKVYYDFETYEETLTQLSFQIFKGDQLLYIENLVFNPWEEIDSFEEKCIRSLAKPILEIMEGKNILEEDISFLKSQIVYIAFNKSFECSWMRRLASRHSGKNQLDLYSKLIEGLTQDLADWFKFSKNHSLNLIGELFKSHSLKKVVEVIWKEANICKKYSNLEWAQNGREASLLFLYFYTEVFGAKNLRELANRNKEISFKSISSEEQEKQKREWERVKRSLESYCELDVQTMIDGVRWLEEQYSKNEKKLVKRVQILSFIEWFSSMNASQIAEHIKEFMLLSSC